MTLSAGYFLALFVFSFYANFRNEIKYYKYLIFLKAITGVIFIASFNVSYILFLFGLLDITIAGIYYLQYKNDNWELKKVS